MAQHGASTPSKTFRLFFRVLREFRVLRGRFPLPPSAPLKPTRSTIPTMRLLLVEDDVMIGEAVLDALRAEHYAVDWVRDGAMADTALRTETYDLVLLDLGLPQRDGLDVLRGLRAKRLAV